jgi:hypothetical protein
MRNSVDHRAVNRIPLILRLQKLSQTRRGADAHG